MKNIYRILLLTLLIITGGCKKFLETAPSDFVSPEYYYNTEAELQFALNGVYNQLGLHEIYGAYVTYWLTSSNDETYPRTIAPAVAYDYGSDLVYVDRFWKALYEGIQRANLLIDNVNKPQMDETKRGIIKGEALFLRAYFHYLLVLNFGDVPLIIKPTPSVNDVNLARTPSKIVYDQILQDMTAAESLLQSQTATSVGYGGKVSRSAVQGILARVCLTMAGYPLKDVSKFNDVLKWTQKVIDSKEHALNPDYKDIFIRLAQDRYDIKESIWEAEMYGNETGGYWGGSQALGNFIGIRGNSTGNAAAGSSSQAVYPTKRLYDSYQINPASAGALKTSFDLRRDWNCANFDYSGTNGAQKAITNTWLMSPGKFRWELTLEAPKNRNKTPINCPILRYADVLLMKAEAENELHGPTGIAYEAVNEVRRRAYGKTLLGETLKSIAVTAEGSGYTAATSVTLTGGGGTGATATAVITAGRITAIQITNPGSFYTSSPNVIINGIGSGAAATAAISTLTDADFPVNLDKDRFREWIQDERSRELFTEALRKYDLIRWGIFTTRMREMIDYGRSNSAPSAFYTSFENAAPRYLLLPIPSREIGLNKSLVQNPGF
ncbi:hypothetical protein HDC92_004891 [Pedobacter sp. AK017]|uniref:RagB/SusD family nutrient uptake outer membrane protein n=1 Tax=Pedobacter sp. AK017 TaxID=2723073 RepID=UPI00161A078A|nr:RagB/SusD family nutrient uptake outer membrane protein [Pedobacter sp. AK017]MBB5441184.1 hypothetical protein [Pedobacter sp. AK017]